MIEFALSDYNLGKISDAAKISNLITKTPYRIYGLTQENPPIYIRYNYEKFSIGPKLANIVSFFNKNGINIETYDDDYDNRKVSVGLRRDIRRNVVLSACIIQTIVYALENKLKLDNKNKLPVGIPKFS